MVLLLNKNILLNLKAIQEDKMSRAQLQSISMIWAKVSDPKIEGRLLIYNN
jgi:hypothetical protein